ncbi:MAG: hypothetical protein ACLFPW_00390 [Spirochaetaceae bacterium]
MAEAFTYYFAELGPSTVHGVEPKEAETLLEGLTDGQRVDMQVDSDGVVRYVFREFTP